MKRLVLQFTTRCRINCVALILLLDEYYKLKKKTDTRGEGGAQLFADNANCKAIFYSLRHSQMLVTRKNKGDGVLEKNDRYPQQTLTGH